MAFLQFPQLLFVFGYFPWVVYVRHGLIAPLMNGNGIRIILAIILPPVGVFLQVGFGLHFWLNILLTILGYIPGIIHAVWVITKY
ncbi:hypothetical protein BH20ACT10_BH20ACT10_23960 [soil metagenome]